MTPNDIEFLIHCYVSPRRHDRVEAPAIKEAIEMFLAGGMISSLGGKKYETTDKGAAHVAQICSLPWPKATFIGFNGQEIKL